MASVQKTSARSARLLRRTSCRHASHDIGASAPSVDASSDLGAATGVDADEIGVSETGVDCISSAFKVQVARVYVVRCSLLRAPFEMTFPLFAMSMFDFVLWILFENDNKCTNNDGMSAKHEGGKKHVNQKMLLCRFNER